VSQTPDTQIRAALAARRMELLQRIARLRADIRRDADPLSTDAEDRATQRENDEVVDSILGAAQMELKEVEAALERIATGTYGLCASCGRPIGAKRLGPVPYAERCQECEAGRRRHLLARVVAALALLVLASPGVHSQDFVGRSGAQLYVRFCASCHGAEGYGNGPVAASFRIEVPDLTRIARRHGGTFPEDQVRRIIDGRKALPPHGMRVMPVWGYEFAPDDRDKLIGRLTEYLKAIQKTEVKVRLEQ